MCVSVRTQGTDTRRSSLSGSEPSNTESRQETVSRLVDSPIKCYTQQRGPNSRTPETSSTQENDSMFATRSEGSGGGGGARVGGERTEKRSGS